MTGYRVTALLLLACAAGAQSTAPAPAGKTSNCVDCHTQQHGKLQQAVTDWLGSVHEKAGVGCHDCHGGHATDPQLAHSPGHQFIGRPRLREHPYMCGKCHAEIRDKHVGSVHGANGLPHCVSCHGAHAVSPPDPTQIINEAECSKCHTYDKAATAQEMLKKANGLLAQLETFAGEIDHVPGVLGPLREMQRKLRVDREGIITTFHSFRIGEIQQIGANVDRVLKTMQRLREREEHRHANFARERPVILMLMGFFVLATAFGYVVYHGKHGAKTPEPPAHA